MSVDATYLVFGSYTCLFQSIFIYHTTPPYLQLPPFVTFYLISLIILVHILSGILRHERQEVSFLVLKIDISV